MSALSGKNIVLGVTGSIAAYRAADIVSQLKKLGAAVHCCMTKAACEFIGPITLQTLSGNPVRVDLFDRQFEQVTPHIRLAELADLFVVAPCDANFIGKLSWGMADDFLSTTALAARAPILLAPAMNVNMYENPTVQENIQRLKDRGVTFIDPQEGLLACGAEGVGKLAAVETIVSAIVHFFEKQNEFHGRHFLITAGPTWEPFDKIRFITNASSGKMGYALAEAAKQRGAEVVLVSGPVHLSPPANVKVCYIKTAEQMREEAMKYFSRADVVIKTAAVSDFKPKNVFKGKLKKEQTDKLTVAFEKTVDILSELGKKKGDKILVGFAAEADRLMQNARQKLFLKNLDMLVANNVSQKGAEMGSDTNIATLLFRDGADEKLPLMKKQELAEQILDRVYLLLKARKEAKGNRREA